MSNVLYPLSLISHLAPSKYERTLIDPFESGATSTRRTWPAQYFKRQIKLTHSPLTATEWAYLRSFYSQRNGLYDSFWFRDNVHREGNLCVRFSTPLQPTFSGSARLVSVDLAEVAPIRALPEFDEVTAAAGTAPLLWFDANRELYYTHAGTGPFTDPSVFDQMLAYPAPWQAGALQLGNILSQYQHYAFTGAQWAKTATNLPLAGTQPAFTCFAICRHSATTTWQALFAAGSAAGPLGLYIGGDGYYRPLSSAAYSVVQVNNSPADTFRSFAASFPSASNTVSFYCNAALVATETVARSYGVGPFTLGALADGTQKTNPGNAMTNANLAHVLIFPAALTLAQVKSLHNLLGYQYGLALV